MQKLPTFNSAKHEFIYFATIAIKTASRVEAIENRLNIVTERVNELIDRDPDIDLGAFKANFLSELETLLVQDPECTPEVHSLDIQDKLNLLELQFEVLTRKVVKIESTLDRNKMKPPTNSLDI